MTRFARSRRKYSLVVLSSFILLLFLSKISVVETRRKIVPDGDDDDNNSKTYYDILEVRNDATLTDIKKAYRKLALLHHPDRNIGKEEESAIKFRKVAEAYEVLSNDKSRAEYDTMLKFGGGGTSQRDFFHNRWQHEHDMFDPFKQFNNLFQNDPFFQEAFKGMDDLFRDMFEHNDYDNLGTKNGQKKHSTTTNSKANKTNQLQHHNRGFFGNLLNLFGITFDISTSSTIRDPKDGRKTTHTTKSYSSGGSSGGGGYSTYTSRSTRTIIENGRRVTIQSLEKDGNRIEEKYVNNELVERLINGKPDDLLIEAPNGDNDARTRRNSNSEF